MKLQFKGFSLIELMIVIAIIGILASLAVPSYRNYVIRSHATELIDATGAAQTAVSDMLQGVGLTSGAAASAAVSGTPCANLQTSYAANVATTQNLAKLAISGACVITTTGTTTVFGASPLVITASPYLNSDGSVTWACTSGKSAYAPSTCQ